MKKDQEKKVAEKLVSRRGKVIDLVQENKWTIQELAGKDRPPRTGVRLPSQHRRRQCRRPHEAPGHGPRSGGGGN